MREKRRRRKVAAQCSTHTRAHAQRRATAPYHTAPHIWSRRAHMCSVFVRPHLSTRKDFSPRRYSVLESTGPPTGVALILLYSREAAVPCALLSVHCTHRSSDPQCAGRPFSAFTRSHPTLPNTATHPSICACVALVIAYNSFRVKFERRKWSTFNRRVDVDASVVVALR